MLLSLASLAHWVPCAEALHQALQTRAPSGKRLVPTLQLRRAMGRSSGRTPHSRWQRWAANQDAAPGSAIWRRSSAAVPAHKNSSPFRAEQKPIKAAPPTAFQLKLGSRAQAHTSPFFDQRIKLSLASKPNSVSFCWLR